MNLKKGLSLILCLCMAGTVMTGCGEQKSADGGKDTVTIWSVNSHSKSVYEKLVNEFNDTTGKEKGIYIDYQIKDSSTIIQNIELALQNGTAPDMFTSGDLKKLVGNKNLVAIEDLPGGDELIAKYKDDLVDETHTYNGKTYTLPQGATTQGLIYNKEMFKNAGIVDENGEAKPPTTWAELVEDAKLLTNPENKEYGIILPQKWSGWVGSDITSPLQTSIGNMGFDPVKGVYDYTGLDKIIDAYLQMKSDGSIYPGAEGIDNDPARALFAAGGIGMKMGFSFDVGVLNDQFPAKIDWGVAPYPSLDADTRYKSRMDIGQSFFINAEAPNHISGEKLIEVLKFFLDDSFVMTEYKEGTSIPYKWDIVADVELENPKKGWKEFCELASQGARYPNEPDVDKSAMKTLEDRIMQDVWSGNISAEEMVKQYTDEMNTALEQYKNDSSKPSIDKYIIPDWNIKE